MRGLSIKDQIPMEGDIRRFAEHIYTENVEPLLEPEDKIEKDSFVNSFSKLLKHRIKSGLAQFKNGECMDFEEFENKFRKEFLIAVD